MLVVLLNVVWILVSGSLPSAPAVSLSTFLTLFLLRQLISITAGQPVLWLLWRCRTTQSLNWLSTVRQPMPVGLLSANYVTRLTRVHALDRLLLSVPQIKGMPDASCIIECGRDTGLWLSTTSSSIGWTILGNQEFEDALRLCFALLPNNLPSKCDGFSANFQIGHAPTCKFLGHIHTSLSWWY